MIEYQKKFPSQTETTRTVAAITNFIFVDDEVDRADVIILPGSSHIQLIKRAIQLYLEEKAGLLIFTGGYNEKIQQTESEWAKKLAIEAGIPESAILTESRSTNTKENAIEARSLLEKSAIDPKVIVLPSKTYHSRRLLMTFQKLFPNCEILISGVTDGRDITRDNWTESPEKIAVVMEEIRKISAYYLKGDLEL